MPFSEITRFRSPCDRLRTAIASFACVSFFFLVLFVKRKGCGVMERRGGMEYGFEKGIGAMGL